MELEIVLTKSIPKIESNRDSKKLGMLLSYYWNECILMNSGRTNRARVAVYVLFIIISLVG